HTVYQLSAHRPSVERQQCRHVAAQTRLDRRLAVAEEVVGYAEPRRQVLVFVPGRIGEGDVTIRQQPGGAEMERGEPVVEVVEAGTQVQRQPFDRTSVLRGEAELRSNFSLDAVPLHLALLNLIR